jgi:hypothetical protein
VKNIMVIDGAENCVYDIVATPDDDFALIFPEATDIALIEDIERRADAELVFEALKRTWSNGIAKAKRSALTGSCSTSCTPSASTTQPCGMRKLSIPTVRLYVSHATARLAKRRS